MKTGFLITARLKSTRLPDKLLREVCGRPILAHMLDRLKLAKRVNQIVVCTSVNPQDDRLVNLAASENVACFRGDEEDVLKRLYDAAVAFNLDYILNITGDCPFSDPLYADRIVDAFETTRADLIRALDLPHGAFSYGIKPSALQRVLEIKDDKSTEVWGRYFSDTDLFDVYDLPISDPLHRQPGLRMTLDYPEDLEFFKAIFSHLYQAGKVFSLDDILCFLRAHPEVVEINRHCAAAYETRWTRQSKIKLKPRYKVRRAAVLGCDSMGQRHIRNLRALGIDEIVNLRTRPGHSQQLDSEVEIQEIQGWRELRDVQPDVAIITGATSLYLETAARLIPYVRGLFIENPLTSSMDGVKVLLDQVKAHKVISFVGYDLQFHAAARVICELLEGERLGRPLLLQCQVGGWLPKRHEREDYREAHYAWKELDEGAALSLIQEVHLALGLLGRACAVSCLLSHSDLPLLDVDATVDMMVQHASGAVSQIHLDHIQRPMHRRGVVSCERGWIEYDLVLPRVVVQCEEEPVPRVAWGKSDYDENQSYIEEMRTFLQYVREGRMRHEFDIWRGARSLAVVDAAFASARSRCVSDLPAWAVDLG